MLPPRRVHVPLRLRALCFLLIPPLYLFLWAKAWFTPWVWELDADWPGSHFDLISVKHESLMRATWENALGALMAAALKQAGPAFLPVIRTALLPYTPEEP